MIDRRTYLAGQALAGMLSNPATVEDLTISDAAADCVRYADAIIAEMSRQPHAPEGTPEHDEWLNSLRVDLVREAAVVHDTDDDDND